MAFLEELRNSMGGGSPTKGAAKSVDPNDLKDLGLGGLPSFLGTREDAAAGKRGDAQIAATLTDSLPGYFNPETRDYVPWYIDLFDGGGINRSAGMLDAGSGAQSQAVGGLISPMRPTMRPEGPLGPFGGAGPSIPEGPLGPFGGAGPRVQDTPDTSYYTPPSSMQMPMQAKSGAPMPTPQSSQSIPASGGNMAINTPAAQGRDQMISDQMDLQGMNQMLGHPLYQSFVQSPFGEGDKKYYPTEFFKYLQSVGG